MFSGRRGRVNWEQMGSVPERAANNLNNDLKWVNGTKYSSMDQVKFVEDSLSKIWSDMACLSRPYHFRFFKGSWSILEYFIPVVLFSGKWTSILTLRSKAQEGIFSKRLQY